jgi:hypothetical protein
MTEMNFVIKDNGCLTCEYYLTDKNHNTRCIDPQCKKHIRKTVKTIIDRKEPVCEMCKNKGIVNKGCRLINNHYLCERCLELCVREYNPVHKLL